MGAARLQAAGGAARSPMIYLCPLGCRRAIEPKTAHAAAKGGQGRPSSLEKKRYRINFVKVISPRRL
jgi:hypothetical protein